MLQSKNALLTKEEQLTKSYADISSLNQRIDAIKLKSDSKTFQIEELETQIQLLYSQIEQLKTELVSMQLQALFSTLLDLKSQVSNKKLIVHLELLPRGAATARDSDWQYFARYRKNLCRTSRIAFS